MVKPIELTKITTTTLNTTNDLITSIKEATAADTNLQKIIKIKQEDNTNNIRYKPYIYENVLLYIQYDHDVQPRLVIPNDISIKRKIIFEEHDTPYSGHPGIKRTYEKIKKKDPLETHD